jgi:hypothetical protein
MSRLIASLLIIGATAGCAHLQQLSNSSGNCFVDSGWLDSSNGCLAEAYPDCYLVCTKAGLRVRVEDVPYVVNSSALDRDLH